MDRLKPLPKTQKEIFNSNLKGYVSPPAIIADKLRGNDISWDGDKNKNLYIGLETMDEALIYYFNNVLKLSVNQNDEQVIVPVMYGSPERWVTIQKKGVLRDKNSKIITPLIVFKQSNIQRNRELGNKLDGNNVHLFHTFETKYSQRNVYDNFNILNNRIPQKEYHTIVVPDYVDLTYDFQIFTDYVEQMNKLIEAINFASDSYWGNPEKFQFRVSIDSFSPITENVQGEERYSKTRFSLKLKGYMIPDSINKSKAFNAGKYFSKCQVVFNMETDYNPIENKEIIIKSKSVKSTSFMGEINNIINVFPGVNTDEMRYINTNISKLAEKTLNTNDTVTFTNVSILNPPATSSLPLPTIKDFVFYINGQYISIDNIISFEQVGNNLVLTVDNIKLGYNIETTDEVIVIGKIQND